MTHCPCGSTNDYKNCCLPYISGEKNAPSAESTMRARYSAFVKGEIDYIEKTHDPKTKDQFDREGISDWSHNSKWISLEIVNTDKGSEKDSEGMVEFVAKYEVQGVEQAHHELSQFKLIDGFWYFIDGKVIRNTVRRTAPKVGRNDPCSCGSGKKYKKCCMQ